MRNITKKFIEEFIAWQYGEVVKDDSIDYEVLIKNEGNFLETVPDDIFNSIVRLMESGVKIQ